MKDTIYRQAAIEAVSKACFELRGVFGRCEDALNALSSAQPEIKPIDYQDCANAMLRMWMDKVVTSGGGLCVFCNMECSNVIKETMERGME